METKHESARRDSKDLAMDRVSLADNLLSGIPLPSAAPSGHLISSTLPGNQMPRKLGLHSVSNVSPDFIIALFVYIRASISPFAI